MNKPDLDAIEARHIAWYNDDDSSAEWPDEIDFVVSYEMSGDSTLRSRAMAHEIVREDVPALLALVREQQAQIERVEQLHYEGVAYADDVSEGGDEVVPEDYEHHYCNEDGENWPCMTIAALTATEAKPRA